MCANMKNWKNLSRKPEQKFILSAHLVHSNKHACVGNAMNQPVLVTLLTSFMFIVLVNTTNVACLNFVVVGIIVFPDQFALHFS